MTHEEFYLQVAREILGDGEVNIRVTPTSLLPEHRSALPAPPDALDDGVAVALARGYHFNYRRGGPLVDPTAAARRFGAGRGGRSTNPPPASTLPPTPDPDLQRFEQDVKEAGEYEARLAELARKILAPSTSPGEKK